MWRSINPFAVFAIGVIVLFALIWNHYQLPTILWGKKATADGIVLDTYPIRVKHGFLQDITYGYQVSGQYHIAKRRIGKSFPYQFAGNRVRVEYQLDQPNRHNLIGFFSDYSRRTSTRESYKDSVGTLITLRNGIVSFRHTSTGSLDSVWYGFGEWANDTLQVHLLNEKERLVAIPRNTLRKQPKL
jgi:hypothetical protein